jgi:Fe/S biogenesis protein NfuA
MLFKSFRFNVTNVAIIHFKALLFKECKKGGLNIKLMVCNGGTDVATINLVFCYKGEESPSDIVINLNYFLLYIPKSVSCYLKNSSINYRRKLILKAPFLKRTNTSSILNKVLLEYTLKFFIEEEINPVLREHSGFIVINRLTINGFLFISFNGNCVGCSQLNDTFKVLVKKKIQEKFKQIKAVYIY